ncbi:MAG: ATP-binding protein [Nitrospiraceae bacterium]|nr:ATP-binding protein [Nitrospiraceae bacterium]
MLLKKKIALSFFISAFIIAILVMLEYVNFIKIKKEIMYLEVTDTIRSKSLQLRRHEKNFFLRNDLEELKSVFVYLRDLKKILEESRHFDDSGALAGLENKILDYERNFRNIEVIFWDFQRDFGDIKPSHIRYEKFFDLIESTFLERPNLNADLLQNVFSLDSQHKAVRELKVLDADMNALKRNGEDIVVISRELDKGARAKVDHFIRTSQIAILILFPMFLIIGIGIFLFIISNVVRRLEALTKVVERTGEGKFSPLAVPAMNWADNDEVGVLIGKFNDMEEQLAQREKELIQSKKLAAIGTLASGVAHELNNPLNNIFTTSQRLLKKAGDECPPFVQKSLSDIYSETMRVKKIVGDLLEFARGREPHMRPLELRRLIQGAYRHLGNSVDIEKIRFSMELHPQEVVIDGDQEQLEQVFINLFTNAVQAMSGEGELKVNVDETAEEVRIRVSDTGKGMSAETLEKIFEPFYTTKDKGTGLGLAIVFNIVQKHNGKIEAESESGKGAIFRITLPKQMQGR